MGAWGGGETRPERRPPADRESHSSERAGDGPRRFPAQENTTCPSPRAGRPVPRRRRFDRLTDTGRGKGSGRVRSRPGSALLLFGPAAPRCFLRAPTPRPIRSLTSDGGGREVRSVRLSTLRLGRPGRARSPSSAQRSAGSRLVAAEWLSEPSGSQASCRSRASRSRRRGHITAPSAKPSLTWGAPSIRSVLAETKTTAPHARRRERRTLATSERRQRDASEHGETPTADRCSASAGSGWPPGPRSRLVAVRAARSPRLRSPVGPPGHRPGRARRDACPCDGGRSRCGRRGPLRLRPHRRGRPRRCRRVHALRAPRRRA